MRCPASYVKYNPPERFAGSNGDATLEESRYLPLRRRKEFVQSELRFATPEVQRFLFVDSAPVHRENRMKLHKIPKRSGGYRTICCPSAARKRLCRALIPNLQAIVRKLCDLDVVHGFAELRSPVTNAARHVGYQYTVSFDLKDFFDTVEMQKVKAVQNTLYKPCFHKGVAQQGLPTSPIVANIAAAEMDKQIQDWLNTRATTCVYTRYADDLTVSFNDPDLIGDVKGIVAKAVHQHRFVLNEDKTTVQCARTGRRIITGVAVDDTGIYPTRKAKRKLRAAIHNAKTGKVKHFPRRQWTRYVKQCRLKGVKPKPQKVWLRRWLQARVRGLEEWIKLKPPITGRRSAGRIAEVYPPAEALAEIAARNHPRP